VPVQKQKTDIEMGGGLLGPSVSQNGIVQCVFSTMEKIKVGTGTTTRRHVSKIYWFVEQEDETSFSVRRINNNHVPTGKAKLISLDMLMENYLPEVEFWEMKTIPAVQHLEGVIKQGESDRQEGKYYSAEHHFKKALSIDEDNIRSLFNLGLTYLSLDAHDKARDMMEELLKFESSFMGKDQHLFNEFGIALRKNGMLDEAAVYYRHALTYVSNDEHLFYNLSRVHYERSDWKECVNALDKSRELNPQLKAACDLSKIVLELARNPELCQKHGKTPVPRDLMERIVRYDGPVRTQPIELGQGAAPEKGRARSRVGAKDSVMENDSQGLDEIDFAGL